MLDRSVGFSVQYAHADLHLLKTVDRQISRKGDSAEKKLKLRLMLNLMMDAGNPH